MLLFIYHENCADGFGAALATHLLTGDCFDGNPVIYQPAQYNSPLPETAGKYEEVIIADFSYPLEQMLELHRRHPGKVTLLDHHKTALEQLAGKIPPEYIFDLHRSGARLAWDYWAVRTGKRRVLRPLLIDYIEDRDLWKWELPESKEVSAALREKPYDLGVWRNLTIEQLVKEGRVRLAKQKEEVNRLAGAARMTEIGGYLVPAVYTDDHMSEVCHELLRRHPESRFAAAYYATEQGERKYSLRSREDFDVSEIAGRYGGGGHRQAAGFTKPAR